MNQDKRVNDSYDVREPVSDVFATRYNLTVTLESLPYAGQVELRAPRWDYGSDDEFMARITLWLTSYRDVVAAAKTTTARMASELSELRNERAAVRSFFGNTNREGERSV